MLIGSQKASEVLVCLWGVKRVSVLVRGMAWKSGELVLVGRKHSFIFSCPN